MTALQVPLASVRRIDRWQWRPFFPRSHSLESASVSPSSTPTGCHTGERCRSSPTSRRPARPIGPAQILPRGRPRGKIIPTDIRTILYFDSGVEIDRVRELDATGLMG